MPATGLASWSKFCNLPFVLFLISNFILYAFYDIMYTFMPDYAVGDLKVTLLIEKECWLFMNNVHE